jgi:hypothetical protein
MSDDQNAKTPTLSQVIKKGASTVAGRMHTVVVGKVESYDAQKNEADVKPVVSQRFNDGTSEEFPVLMGCPVIQPEFGAFNIKAELKKGQEVLLLVNERSIDEWFVTGNSPVEATDPRRFDLSDAFVLGGVRNGTNPNTPSQGEFKVGATDGSIEVTFSEGGKVKIGNGTVELLDLFDQLITALQSAVVATSSGPKPLDTATLTALSNLKTLLSQIKG